MQSTGCPRTNENIGPLAAPPDCQAQGRSLSSRKTDSDDPPDGSGAAAALNSRGSARFHRGLPKPGVLVLPHIAVLPASASIPPPGRRRAEGRDNSHAPRPTCTQEIGDTATTAAARGTRLREPLGIYHVQSLRYHPLHAKPHEVMRTKQAVGAASKHSRRPDLVSDQGPFTRLLSTATTTSPCPFNSSN